MSNLIKLVAYSGTEYIGVIIDHYKEVFFDDYSGDLEYILAIVVWTDGQTTAEEWVMGSAYYKYVDGEWVQISSEKEWMEFLCSLKKET